MSAFTNDRIATSPSGARWGYRLAAAAAVVFIVAAIWVVYWPSLGHIAGADHFDYLINTFGRTTFWDIFTHTYSYNRTRTVGVGDTMCFRPLFFAWLAWQQAWYETNFAAWQATGIALHCVVCGMLFRLVWLADRFRRGDSVSGLLLAVAVTTFFAVNPNVMVMVTWTHIHAYLVFMICTLAALELVLRQAMDAGPSRAASWLRLGTAWLLICTASFTYELGQFLAVLVGAFLLIVSTQAGNKRRGILLLLAFVSIALLYQTTNAVDWHLHTGQYEADLNMAAITGRAFSFDSLKHACRLSSYAMLQPFFPTRLIASFSGRVEIQELAWTDIFSGLWPVLGAAAACLWLLSALPGLRRPNDRTGRVLAWGAAIVGLLLAIHLGMLVLGRMNMRPDPELLQRNSYYAYMPLALLVVLSAMLWPASWTGRLARLRGPVCWTLIALLGLVAGRGGVALQATNGLFTRYQSARGGLDIVHRFIQQHRGEPHFSLAFDATQSRYKGIPLITILFKRYEDNDHPRYVASWRGTRLTFLTLDEYLAMNPNRQRPLFPDLVKIGPRYHIYQVAGRYQPVLYQDDWWQAAGETATLAQAEALAEDRLRQRDAQNPRSPH